MTNANDAKAAFGSIGRGTDPSVFKISPSASKAVTLSMGQTDQAVSLRTKLTELRERWGTDAVCDIVDAVNKGIGPSGVVGDSELSGVTCELLNAGRGMIASNFVQVTDNACEIAERIG